jgi:hypothetical protein
MGALLSLLNGGQKESSALSQDALLMRWARRLTIAVETMIAGLIPGVVYEIRFPIGLVTTSSVTPLPAGAVEHSAELHIVTPYSPGTTITLGTLASPTGLMEAVDSQPAAVPVAPSTSTLFRVSQDTTGLTGPVLATVAGAPVVGSAFAIVRYSIPLP